MLASRLKGWSALLKSSWRQFEPEILPRVCLTDAGQVHLNEFHHQNTRAASVAMPLHLLS